MLAYSGTGALPGAITYVLPGDSAATIQSKLNSVQAGDSLVFTGGATYDFGGATITGKSGITVWADGPVVIANAPGAGTRGAFDFSGQSDWTIGGNSPGNGFVFNGSLINATNASGDWTIGNATFNNQQSSGYDGSAIRMNGASYGTIINNDFNNAGGNVIGMYNLDHITIDGNRFVDCYEPISIQSPTNADRNYGNDIIIENNVFLGTQRAAIEIGPANPGTEYFSGLVINNNYFDNFNNSGGESWDTMLAISAVGQSSENTTITNNYISRGPNAAGASGVAIEMTGTGEVSGNTIVNFGFAALAYQSGWNFHDNVVYNDGSSPYYGFANNGSGSGTFGSVIESATLPANPGLPARTAWGTEVVDGGDGGIVIPPSPSEPTVPPPDTTPPDTTPPDPTVPDTVAPAPQFTGATYSGGQVTLTGTSEPGSEVWVYEGETRIGTAIAGANGVWTMTGAGAAGAYHTYGAVAWDPAGNFGQSGSYSPASTQGGTVSPPASSPPTSSPPVISPDLTAPVPAFTGATYSGGHVTLTGSSEPGSEVWVYEGETRIGTAIAGADGAWTMTGVGDAGAHHTYGAVAWDPAGNFGQSASYSPTASAPGGTASPPASSPPASSPPASSPPTASPDLTAPAPDFTGATYSGGHVTLTGTSEPGSEVWVYEGETRIGTAITGTDGTWAMTGVGDAGAHHTYGAIAWDPAGNFGQSGSYSPTASAQGGTASASPPASSPPASSPQVASPDLTAPVPDFTGATYSGGLVTLTGTSEPGSEVWVYEGETRVGAAITGADGTWAMTGIGASGVHHTYGAVAWDPAGNFGQSDSYTADTTVVLVGVNA